MEMKNEITNSQDFIDSRDIIERIRQLEALEDDADDDDKEELRILTELEKQTSESTDWRHGETLIRDSYFTEYAEELASDTGAISRDAQWPLTHIDWDAAADDLKQDYMSVDFDGVDYWIRA